MTTHKVLRIPIAEVTTWGRTEDCPFCNEEFFSSARPNPATQLALAIREAARGNAHALVAGGERRFLQLQKGGFKVEAGRVGAEEDAYYGNVFRYVLPQRKVLRNDLELVLKVHELLTGVSRAAQKQRPAGSNWIPRAAWFSQQSSPNIVRNECYFFAAAFG